MSDMTANCAVLVRRSMGEPSGVLLVLLGVAAVAALGPSVCLLRAQRIGCTRGALLAWPGSGWPWVNHKHVYGWVGMEKEGVSDDKASI